MRVVVIGAGVGGMSAALRLAKAGHEVIVLEQGERVGGKLNVWEPEVPGAGQFHFDTGPHVLTMPWAIRELFEDLGERMEDYLDLVRMDPICRYHFPDHMTFDAPADPEEAVRRVAAQFPGDEAGFRALLDYARQVHDVTVDPFLRQDFGEAVRGIPTPAQWRQLGQFLQLKPWQNLHDLTARHLSHPRLRQIFDLYAFYNGSSPYKASAIFAIIAWVQWGDGTYYLRGGLRTYADALARLAEKFGIDIRFHARATMIETGIRSPDEKPQRGTKTYKAYVRGVDIHKQGRVLADVVVCNADPLTFYERGMLRDQYIPPQFYPPSRLADYSHKAFQPSTSAFVLLLGVRGTPKYDFPHLAHFNSFLPEDPKAEFEAIFTRGVPAEDPVIGVTCQSVTEPESAPSGYTNLFVMTSPPALGPNGEWNSEKTQAYRDHILSLLETRCGMPGLRERIVCEQVWTPQTFQERYGAWRGSLYGVSSNGWRSAFLRPPNRNRKVKGLYFVGGGTHPGGGLPLVTLGGKIVAASILQNEAEPDKKFA